MQKTKEVQYVVIKNQKHPGAAIFAFLFPGLGHFVRGKFLAALFWFVIIMVTAPTIIGGIIFWVWSIKSAYN